MLSEEEKKAIENLKDFKSISILYGNTFTMFLDQLEKYQEATDTILNLINKLQKENKELKKYDYRNIKIDEKDELQSPSIPKEHLALMNLGIALYIGIPKLLEDEKETDI